MNFHYGGYDFRKDLEPTIISFAVFVRCNHLPDNMVTQVCKPIFIRRLSMNRCIMFLWIITARQNIIYGVWKKAFYVNPLCQYYEMFLQFFDSLAFVLSGLQKCWLWCQHSLNKQSGWSWSSLWLIAKRIYFFIMMLQHSQLLGEQKKPLYLHIYITLQILFFCAWHFVIFMIE